MHIIERNQYSYGIYMYIYLYLKGSLQNKSLMGFKTRKSWDPGGQNSKSQYSHDFLFFDYKLDKNAERKFRVNFEVGLKNKNKNKNKKKNKKKRKPEKKKKK